MSSAVSANSAVESRRLRMRSNLAASSPARLIGLTLSLDPLLDGGIGRARRIELGKQLPPQRHRLGAVAGLGLGFADEEESLRMLGRQRQDPAHELAELG